MFSLVRTPISSPSTSSIAKHHASIASFPFPATTTTTGAAASPNPHSPIMADNSLPRRQRRLAGALFADIAPPPGSPRISTIQGRAYSTAPRLSPRETFPPPSPTFATVPLSPRMPLKSCLKSPMFSKSPMAYMNSPRFTSSIMMDANSREGPLFASNTMATARSREGPLWDSGNNVEASVTSAKSPRFTSSTMVNVKSREGPLWGNETRERMNLNQRLGGDAVEWRNCRTRIPTPFQSPRMEWLGSAGGQSDQPQLHND